MKNAIQGRLEAKRKPGRPRTRYFKNIKKWTGKTTPEIVHVLVVDRRHDWSDVVQRKFGLPTPLVMQDSE